MQYFIQLSRTPCSKQNPPIFLEVDQLIYEKFGHINWTNTKLYGQRIFRVDGVEHRETLHRMIFEYFMGRPVQKGYYVDHIDRNRKNCKFSNLRELTARQSAYNMSKFCTNSTGYIGVSKLTLKDGTVKYRATISDNRHDKHLGRFYTAVEAALVRDLYAVRLRGNLAVLNFPGIAEQKWAVEEIAKSHSIIAQKP